MPVARDVNMSVQALGGFGQMQMQMQMQSRIRIWSPVLLRDRAGEPALLSLDGPLLIGREGGRVVEGDGPRADVLSLSGRPGALLRSGLHVQRDSSKLGYRGTSYLRNAHNCFI